MAHYAQSGKHEPGKTLSINGGGSAPAKTDTVKLNDTKHSISELVRCGVLREVSTVGSTTTFVVMAPPEMVGTQPGG